VAASGIPVEALVTGLGGLPVESRESARKSLRLALRLRSNTGSLRHKNLEVDSNPLPRAREAMPACRCALSQR
jgi:hypothetical protein